MRRIGALLLRVLRGLRTAWEIAGVTALLLLLLLLGVLAVRALRGPSQSEAERADHPYHGQAWFPVYRREFDASLQMEWEPYVYWRRRAMHGEFVNVDEEGLRRTVQAPSASAAPRRVFFMGGSTMWGTGQRDAWTIPSLVASGLAARNVRDLELTNFGETGYVSTQELLRLEMALRKGARPDVVVFYDGINDAASSAQSTECGLPQNESRRSFEFALGRFLTQRTRRDLGALVRTARSRALAGVAGASADPALLAGGIVNCYARTARIVEMLSREYGFAVLYFWQPTPATSPKPLTPYEAAVVDTASPEALHRMLWQLNRLSAGRIDSVMRPVAGERFQNLAAIFADDSSAVWLDYIGHVTESANARIAGAMLEPIVRALALTARTKK